MDDVRIHGGAYTFCQETNSKTWPKGSGAIQEDVERLDEKGWAKVRNEMWY